jgi:hypothetical protein
MFQFISSTDCQKTLKVEVPAFHTTLGLMSNFHPYLSTIEHSLHKTMKSFFKLFHEPLVRKLKFNVPATDTTFTLVSNFHPYLSTTEHSLRKDKKAFFF